MLRLRSPRDESAAPNCPGRPNADNASALFLELVETQPGVRSALITGLAAELRGLKKRCVHFGFTLASFGRWSRQRSTSMI